MKYERPNLEEIELILEGSFLAANSYGGGKDDNENNNEGDWA